MRDYQQKFIQLALQEGVLSFGSFTLKSGRISPYFFNTGKFQTSSALTLLAESYAQTLRQTEWSFDMLMGLAYKGIPLVSATALILYQQHQLDIPYAFNRKQAKAYGDGGLIVGAPLKGKIVLIDDVITAGTAVGDILPVIEAAGAEVAGILVALDRQEKIPETSPVITHKIPVASIISIDNLITYLQENTSFDEAILAKLCYYRQEYAA